jgi:NAD(P)-dependent dehydrogenase (short-subunit alcohol dehydrogenase family)
VAGKWGVNGLTKAAAVEFGERGIRVNSVCPAWTLTPAVERWVEDFPEQAAAACAAIPLRRMARPEEQARTFVWLCSDQASYVTGVNLPADGGTTAG